MLHRQSPEKKRKIFKDALQFQESAAGVVVQRIPSSYLLRILKPLLLAREQAANEDDVDPMEHCPDKTDPVVFAIYTLDRTFASAMSKGVDVLSSAEMIAEEHKVDGAKGNGALFLAWKTAYDVSTKSLGTPQLVGAMVVYKFKRTENFSTDTATTGKKDSDTLDPFFRSEYLLIDTLVSVAPGVGTVLALHACRYGIMRHAKGIVALSYSKKKLAAGAKPESYKIFNTLGFHRLIENASFTTRIYGTWFLMKLDELSLSGLLESGISLCTRAGFTARTKDQLIWRCPR
jgi:hypothetical protein